MQKHGSLLQNSQEGQSQIVSLDLFGWCIHGCVSLQLHDLEWTIFVVGLSAVKGIIVGGMDTSGVDVWDEKRIILSYVSPSDWLVDEAGGSLRPDGSKRGKGLPIRATLLWINSTSSTDIFLAKKDKRELIIKNMNKVSSEDGKKIWNKCLEEKMRLSKRERECTWHREQCCRCI